MSGINLAQTKVTVLVPAFNAEPFILETIKSVLDQTHSNIKVTISVDPTTKDPSQDPTYKLLQNTISDERVNITVNSVRLGWDKNVDSLLENISTSYFAILPHDDLWHPEYIERLLKILIQNPKANCAYANMVVFGTGNFYPKHHIFHNEKCLMDQTICHFIQGAEAVPWRGLTRTRILQKINGFHRDQYFGFIVECEYALQMILNHAIHLPESLYLKRKHSNQRISASIERLNALKTNQKEEALNLQFTRIKDLVTHRFKSSFSKSKKQILNSAIYSAHLRFYQSFISKRLSDQHLETLTLHLSRLELMPSKFDNYKSQLKSIFFLIKSKHFTATGKHSKSLANLESALRYNPSNNEALVNKLIRRNKKMNKFEQVRLFMKLQKRNPFQEQTYLISELITEALES